MRRTIRWSSLLAGAAWLCVFGLGCAEGTSVSPEDVFDPSEATIEGTDEGTMIRMHRVSFPSGTAELLGDSTESLNKFAELFASTPAARYAVEVHTDSAGASSANLQLSRDRARVVRDYLIGVVGGAPQAITATGFGEDFPIANNSTREGRAQNRRVEIIMRPPTGERVYRVRVSADTLDVVFDCDDVTGSPSLEAGDFYILSSFRSEGQLVATSLNTLVQADDGETVVDLGIAAEGLYFATEGASVSVDLRIYESDGSGRRQFERARGFEFRWSDSTRCFEFATGRDDWRCGASGQGEIYADTISYDSRGNPGEDACVVDLDWSISVARVD